MLVVTHNASVVVFICSHVTVTDLKPLSPRIFDDGASSFVPCTIYHAKICTALLRSLIFGLLSSLIWVLVDLCS